MTIYYLYVKTHNITGLKYLGQTAKKDPYKYCGSGKDWLKHLEKHGFDFSTQIIKECIDKKELQLYGRHYSKLWNVVESNEWANKIPETGGGFGRRSGSYTDEEKMKISQRMTGSGNPMYRQDVIQKKSGDNHWMRCRKHVGFIHPMTKSEHKSKITGKNHFRYDHRIYTFQNKKEHIVVSMTCREFIQKFNLGQSSISRLLSGKFKQYKGWELLPNI